MDYLVKSHYGIKMPYSLKSFSGKALKGFLVWDGTMRDPVILVTRASVRGHHAATAFARIDRGS
jgi:hypothetical protein